MPAVFGPPVATDDTTEPLLDAAVVVGPVADELPLPPELPRRFESFAPDVVGVPSVAVVGVSGFDIAFHEQLVQEGGIVNPRYKSLRETTDVLCHGTSLN